LQDDLADNDKDKDEDEEDAVVAISTFEPLSRNDRSEP